MQPVTDSLGRATFHHIAPRDDVRPIERDIRWLKHIERHGPQSSVYLYELTRDTHRCRDTALRRLQKLRAGGYLRLPCQQRATAHADFNPYVYDLTPKARRFMEDQGLAEPTVRSDGHWWHSYTVACVSSSIDIMADREGVRFIPAHELLARRNTTLSLPVGRKKLIPDQLFALDYGGSYRLCALEVDRGTEPRTSPASRKSWAASLELYRRILQQELYKSHYGLRANLLVLWVFSDAKKAESFLKLVSRYASGTEASILVQSTDWGTTPGTRAGPASLFWRKAWTRAGGGPLRLCNR